MLEKIKLILGITNNHFDDLINGYIESGVTDLSVAGINVQLYLDDALVQSAIISYVLMMIDLEKHDLHLNSYALQKDQLRHIEDFCNV